MAVSLTTEQLATFERTGWVRLRAAFAAEDAVALQERMWAELRDDFGIVRDDPSTWRQPRRSLPRAKRDPMQHVVATDRLLGAIDDLLGPVRWRVPSNWGVVLVTFPDRTPGPWTLPASGWHFDFDLHPNADAPRAVQVFTFYSAVDAHGGGTLIVEGSHRLLRRFHAQLSPAARQAPHRVIRKQCLRCDPWLDALTGGVCTDRIAYFMHQTREALGVPVRVVELTGRPGDAILCHPLMLHVAAPNRSDAPRFMRSQRICEATD